MSSLSPSDGLFPPQSRTQYGVYAIPYARAMERSIRDNFMRKDMHDGPMPLDFYMWLIRNEDRTVLVDTGFGERAARERSRDLDIHPIEALAKIGLPAAEITDVVLTHLHFDHAGNLDRFPNVRGREPGYPGPPAQIRASGIPALGSYLGCLAANRTLGQG